MPGYRDNGTLVEETGAGILARDDAETLLRLLRASPMHAGGDVMVNGREGRGAAGQSRDAGGLVYRVGRVGVEATMPRCDPAMPGRGTLLVG